MNINFPTDFRSSGAAPDGMDHPAFGYMFGIRYVSGFMLHSWKDIICWGKRRPLQPTAVHAAYQTIHASPRCTL